MSSIPSIFNERQIKRVILGGDKPRTNVKISLSVILLSRSGTPFRSGNLDQLLSIGFSDIISVETSAENYNLEDMAKRYPAVKFIAPEEKCTLGDMINLGMAEAREEYVLVVWDTIHIPPRSINSYVLKRLTEEEMLCYVPMLSNPQMQSLPVRMLPSVENKALSVTGELVVQDKAPTLYPVDYVGIYNKNKFRELGGYDYTIKSPYWQNLDFSMRAWLWGEQIRMMPQLRFKYETEFQAEDTTPDYSQLKFFLKNIAPRFSQDHAYIPKALFLSYYRNSGCGINEAFSDFRKARSWVEQNRYRFKTDASHLITSWENLPL